MEYVYAAMLLHKAGKKVTEETVTSTLKGAGITPDAARVKALVAALEGVNIDEAIKKAATPVAVAAPAAGGAAPAAEHKKEEKKEEKKSTEEAAAGLGALFG